jgi:predicted nucleic acid-binding protein
MQLVDSSGWIEFFTGGPLADEYARHLKDLDLVVTPTIVLYEVYKKIKREKTEEEALSAVSLMNRTKVVALTESTALFAADLSLKHSLPMADAIVYATALEADCKVITGDAHFRELDRVVFVG